LWKRKSFSEIPLPLSFKVTNIVNNVSISSVKNLLTITKSRKVTASGMISISELNRQLVNYSNYSKLDIVYILLLSMNIPTVTSILNTYEINEVDRMIKNTVAVQLLMLELEKIITNCDSSSLELINTYKHLKDSMCELTNVEKEVKANARSSYEDPNNHSRVNHIDNGPIRPNNIDDGIHQLEIDYDTIYDVKSVYTESGGSTVVYNPFTKQYKTSS
jgi:hypothetical protein